MTAAEQKAFDRIRLTGFRNILAHVAHPEFTYEATREGDNYFLRVVCNKGTCNVTGKSLSWKGRKWRLSEHMTDGEVVQTAFMATLAAIEHETREQFTFMSQAVFDPHYDIYKLVALRSQLDAIKELDHAGTA